MPISDYTYTVLNDGSNQGTLVRGNSSGQSSAQVRYKIAWGDLSGFVEALLPAWTQITAGIWTYAGGHKHPNWSLYARQASYEGIGEPSYSGSVSSWEYAIVTATYEVPTFDVSSLAVGDLFEEELDFNGEVIAIPGKAFAFAGGNTVDGDTAIVMPVIDYNIRFPRVPELPGGSYDAIYDMIGKYNTTEFKGAATKQMLFMGGKISRSISIFGGQEWNYMLAFKFRRIPWTYLFNPLTGAWAEVTAVNGGALLYSGDNLNTLLPT